MSSDRRAHHVERLKQRLTQRGNPYGQMFLILTLTGLAGFLASVALHRIGLDRAMGLRYLLAVMAAYAAFLALLGIWLAINRRRRPDRPTAVVDGDDVADAVMWSDPRMLPDVGTGVAETATDGGSRGLGKLGDIGDVGDGEGAVLVVVLLIIVAVLAAVFASAWILFDAPILLAELLVDGALVAGLARRLRVRTPGQHWALTALRRTFVPFLITAGAFAFVGFCLQYFVPDATTMLEALRIAAQ